jgi:GNAT superfamily N-acetyltransferase
MAADGFAFLDTRMRETETGPVLVCQRDGQVAGAIGPMDIMPDSRGTARLLPQYFGVLPEYRGHGLGRSLWRAAMRWGQEHQAAYQNLQTEVGGASDHLCQSEGLTDLGLVCTSSLLARVGRSRSQALMPRRNAASRPASLLASLL